MAKLKISDRIIEEIGKNAIAQTMIFSQVQDQYNIFSLSKKADSAD
ncbi:hypothetical protein JMG10_42640 [Nostoc ellipsosporum NOK]|nr:hypothetical protein [Nostoc ellipsosporum NOK]